MVKFLRKEFRLGISFSQSMLLESCNLNTSDDDVRH